MKILSFNLRNWNRDCDKDSPYYWKTRLASVEKMIKSVSPDVLCLQECLPPVTQHLLRLGYKRAGFGASHLIMVKKGMKVGKTGFKIHLNWADINGIRIINVHSHWRSDILLKTVNQINELAKNTRTIACGDFNSFFADIFNCGIDLVNVRNHLGMNPEDTFKNFTREDSHGEIDHFYVDYSWKMELCLIKNNYGCKRMSDHIPLLLIIE